jgi:death on curing protein
MRIRIFLSLGLFLALNGYRLIATPVEATITMLALAASEIDEKQLADWVRRSCVKLK